MGLCGESDRWQRPARAYHPLVARKTYTLPPETTPTHPGTWRDLSEVASELASIRGEAMNWLRDPNYGALRLENTDASVEAAMERKGRDSVGPRAACSPYRACLVPGVR